MSKKEKVDKFLNKWLSRKLLVFMVATGGMLYGHITSADWVIIAGMYVGTQGAIDAIERLKGLKRN